MTFIPYQIDYAVTNAAKTLGFSKKKVSFKFGFANPSANGLTGAACRGSEHEVTFIWSLASGKRQLLLDGKDVHYSESGQNGWTSDRAWQHSFPLKDNTVRQTLKVHFISQPANKDIPGSRPFDLRVGGVSYFAFNQIFQLGTAAMTTRVGNHHHTDPDRDMMTAEERRLVAQAKLESLKDFEQQRSVGHSQQQPPSKPAMKHDEDLLLSFDDPAPPAAPVAAAVNGGYVTTSPYPGFTSSISLGSDFQDLNVNSPSMMQQQQQPPPQQDTYNAGYGMPANYSFAGAPPVNPYAPASYQQPAASLYSSSSSSAMTPYQPPAGAPAPSPYAAYSAPAGVPPPNPYAVNTNYSNPYAAPPSPSMQSFASFGSAPSFAQPPKPAHGDAYGYAAPPPQQQQNAYGFAAPPPQQQQQNSYY